MKKHEKIERLSKTRVDFYYKFGYTPNYPQKVFFDEDEYCALLERCMRDNFDYTIEVYGTVPMERKPAPDIIID